MKKNEKRSIIVSAMLVIAICLSLTVGATFALFTSESKVNVAVTAGTVKVTATISGDSAYSPKSIDLNGEIVNDENIAEGNTFANGGFYSIDGNVITIKNVTPGDKVTFTVTLTNYSTVKALYRTKTVKVEDNGLFDGLTLNVGGYDCENVGEWLELNAVGEENSATVITYDCAIGLDADKGIEYQGTSCKIAFIVEAVQWNTRVPSEWNGTSTERPTKSDDGYYHIVSASEFAWLMDYTSKGNTNSAFSGETFVLDTDVDFGGKTISGIGGIDDNIVFTFDGNGHTVSNFKIDGTANAYYAGLFNQFGGIVKNLTVKDATVAGNAMVGAIASNVEGSSAAMINCHAVNCTVIATKKAGGVCGYVADAGRVTNCSATNCTIICASTDENQSGKIVGYVADGCVVEENEESEVTLTRGITCVTTATGLKNAIEKGGEILLLNDIALQDGWTSLKVKTDGMYNPIAEKITINGGGHALSGLTKSLLAPNAARYIEIKNLTIKNSDISYGSGANEHNVGAFVSYVDSFVRSLVIDNCKTENVNVTAGNGSASSAGALVGYAYSHTSDNLNFVLKISNCTVTGGSVTNEYGNAAGIIGMCATGTTSDVYEINKCKVENCRISGEEDKKTGQIVGTVNNDGKLYIKNCDFSGKAYGRIVGTTTKVYVGEVEYNVGT